MSEKQCAVFGRWVFPHGRLRSDSSASPVSDSEVQKQARLDYNRAMALRDVAMAKLSKEEREAVEWYYMNCR